VFECILPEKAIPEMTYTVSDGTLNPPHSLTHSLRTKLKFWGQIFETFLRHFPKMFLCQII